MPQMPPQGQPQAQGPASQQGAPPAQQSQGGAGATVQLLGNVDKAIDHLATVITQSKATNPQEKQLITQIDQLYGKLMQSLGQGDSGEGQADESQEGAAQGQTSPMEAGGNPGAVPHP